MSWTSSQRELQLGQTVSALAALSLASVCRLVVHSTHELSRLLNGAEPHRIACHALLLGGSVGHATTWNPATCKGCTLHALWWCRGLCTCGRGVM